MAEMSEMVRVSVGNAEPVLLGDLVAAWTASHAENDKGNESAAPVAETEATEAVFSESLHGDVTDIIEEGAAVPGQGPMVMSVRLIRPGMGNSRDRHYYSPAVLRRDAHVFEGAKMYETDHVKKDKSTRTWVSTVRKIVRFAPDGSPIAEVVVHDPGFAQRCRNLKESGMLNKMEASILAKGTIKLGQMNGETVKIVEAITAGENVDWVTAAGAGGGAVDIMEAGETEVEGTMTIKIEEKAEAEATTVEETVVEATAVEEPIVEEATVEESTKPLSMVRAASMLVEAKLPQAAIERLAELGISTEQALSEAIAKEKAYIEAITGKQEKRVVVVGNSQPADVKESKAAKETPEERERRIGEVLATQLGWNPTIN